MKRDKTRPQGVYPLPPPPPLKLPVHLKYCLMYHVQCTTQHTEPTISIYLFIRSSNLNLSFFGLSFPSISDNGECGCIERSKTYQSKQNTTLS